MIVTSKNFALKLEEILEDDLPTEIYNETENYVLKTIRQWHSNQHFFSHHTSGSTGSPKKIKISRDKISISARATMRYIDPKQALRSSLLCLNPLHIGGAMVIYRALLFNHDLTIVEPSSSPMAELDPYTTFDLVSMVPMQFNRLTTDEVNRFGVILIGGAPMPIDKTHYGAHIFSTFGMTETVSHFALRKLDDDIYHTIGDAEVTTDASGCLKIKGAITDNQWLETNDLVTLISPNAFRWRGRRDFVINTGGIKVSPEVVENTLRSKISGDFMIGSLPDAALGQKVILICENGPHDIDLTDLDRYSQPREVYFNQPLIRTKNGKIDRISSMRKLLENTR